MSTSRPFAYNPSQTNIPGVNLFGYLSVGTIGSGQITGLTTWNGPDEDLGYVVAKTVPDNTQPTPILGVSASVGFYRSSTFSESSFLYTVNRGLNLNFSVANDASNYLLTNGHWTNYPTRSFKIRVLGDGGAFEAESCLETQLYNINNEGLLSSASIVVTPNGYTEGLLYAVEPNEIGTNLFQRSEEFENSYWFKSNGTITSNNIISPNGIQNADTFTRTSATAALFRSISDLVGVSYTVSVYLKGSTNGNIILGTPAGAPYTTIPITTTWQRYSFTRTGTGASEGLAIYLTSTTLQSVDVWGAQLTPGSTVTNYMPTSDRAIINGTIGDLTVTRATTGTRVNSEGLIEEVPYNLFARSEEFDNGYWVKQRTSIIQNSITAPDGTMTADNLVGTSGNTYAYTGTLAVNVVSNPFNARNQCTFSFYLKYNGLNRIRIIYGTSTSMSGGNYTEVDLQLGIITGSNLVTDPFIEDVGDGWYRVGFTDTISAATNNRFGVGLGDSVKTIADGIDGVFIWGAQLVDGDLPKTYFKTITRLNIPRIDYTNGSCPAILVEPPRTNLILQSQNFSSGWSQEGSSITNNNVTSPEGWTNASTLSELATNDVHRTYRTTAITVVSGSVYTYSFFVKNNNVRYVRLSLTQNASTTIWVAAQFDLDTQTFTSGGGSGGGTFSNAYITPYANGWYRIGIAASIPSTLMIPMLVLSNGASITSSDTRGCPVYLGNVSNSLQFYGGQLELAPNMSSYIPTTTAAVTRNADVITNTNASTLIGQTEGTIFIDYNKVLMNDGSRNIISLNDGTINNMIEIWDGVGSGNLGRIVYVYYANNTLKVAGIGQPSVSPSGRYKICLTYLITPSLVNFKFFINGVKIDDRNVTYTAFSNLLDRVNIGNRNSTGVGAGSHNLDFISKTRITDQQAINLTTL